MAYKHNQVGCMIIKASSLPEAQKGLTRKGLLTLKSEKTLAASQTELVSKHK